jgi:4-hydroxybenzoate polyprenyltransferase
MQAEAVTTASPQVLLRAVFAPLVHRLRLGEGMLLLVNLSVIWVRAPGVQRALLQVAASLGVLALLYAHNDLEDAPGDRLNPKKSQDLVALFAGHEGALRRSLGVAELLAIVATTRLLGPQTGAVVLAAFGLNVVYSARLKRVPVLDVLGVGLIGALYTRLAEPPWTASLLIGSMTAACHVFQTLVDRRADERTESTTTAVWSYPATLALLLVTCGLLALQLWRYFGVPGSATAVVPFVLACSLRRETLAWLLTKAYFGVLWLAILQLGRLLP